MSFSPLFYHSTTVLIACLSRVHATSPASWSTPGHVVVSIASLATALLLACWITNFMQLRRLHGNH